jgi:hypothetical protein
MVLDRPVTVGAAGRHGSDRYRVTAYEPGWRVEFAVDARLGCTAHTLVVEPRGARSTVLQHRIDGRTSGAMRLLWPLAVRWLHDSFLEDLLDRAELAHGTSPRRPARLSAWVRLHRLLDDRARARETAVPDIRVLLRIPA